MTTLKWTIYPDLRIMSAIKLMIAWNLVYEASMDKSLVNWQAKSKQQKANIKNNMAYALSNVHWLCWVWTHDRGGLEWIGCRLSKLPSTLVPTWAFVFFSLLIPVQHYDLQLLSWICCISRSILHSRLHWELQKEPFKLYKHDVYVSTLFICITSK